LGSLLRFLEVIESLERVMVSLRRIMLVLFVVSKEEITWVITQVGRIEAWRMKESYTILSQNELIAPSWVLVRYKMLI